VRAIPGGGHDPSHPFYFEDSSISQEERAGLIASIRDNKPAHILEVQQACSCTYISPLLPGHPLQDFGLGPDGNRLIAPSERRISWPAYTLQAHLGELASGLAELHRLGIAHGDPAVMNAYIHQAEAGPVAVWVDLNSTLAATARSIAMDIVGFETTCLWPSLIDAGSFSPSLFRELIETTEASSLTLEAMESCLRSPRNDYQAIGARACLVSLLNDRDAEGNRDLLAQTRASVSRVMAPTYFLDQTRADQNARFFSAALGVERQRHMLLEEERTRLHGIRYQDEIRTLSSEVDRLNREIESLTSSVTERQQALDSSYEEQAVLRQALKAENASSIRAQQQNAILASSLNEIYDSRAWRAVTLVRRFLANPLRSLSGQAQPTGQPRTVAEPPDELAPSTAPTIESFPYLVSVIMPVFNKGTTLRSSVESVRSQTLEPVEIVLWDDGSVDPETMAILEEVSRLPNVHLFRTTNRGVVAARNHAIAMARGRYICCLDPDDEIAPTYLEVAVALLESHPEISITYPWVRTVGDIEEVWQTADLDPSLILDSNHVPVCAVFRREVFHETGGFSPSMDKGYEDWEFWAHAAELGFKGKVIPSCLFEYRYSASDTTSRDAQARDVHGHLRQQILQRHPQLAGTGMPFTRVTDVEDRPVGAELGPRRLPGGQGRPVVLTIPWLTVGGADRVVEGLVRHWDAAGRTVVVFMTTPLAEGMADRKHVMMGLTPYVYNLPDFLPRHRWYEFVASTIGALEAPVLLNVGSSWFYEVAEGLRRDFPALRLVDQQFNSIGHLSGNRDVADIIDLTVAAYSGLADRISADGRPSDTTAVYVGIERPEYPDIGDIEEFRQEVGVATDDKIILFVGRLSEEKRPEWVLALSMEDILVNTRVVIIGDGPLSSKICSCNQGQSGFDLDSRCRICRGGHRCRRRRCPAEQN
jgi:GT2 family glycosyltransferase